MQWAVMPLNIDSMGSTTALSQLDEMLLSRGRINPRKQLGQIEIPLKTTFIEFIPKAV